MTTANACLPRRAPMPAPLAVFLLLLLLLLLATVAALPRLGEIPFTDHARHGHNGQAFNATIISQRLATRQCSPILTYACKTATIVLCPVGPDLDALWTGLVIGTATGEPAVVTGFAAPRAYWQARVASCLPVSYVP